MVVRTQQQAPCSKCLEHDKPACGVACRAIKVSECDLSLHDCIESKANTQMLKRDHGGERGLALHVLCMWPA